MSTLVQTGPPAIEVAKIVKRYGDFEAVKGMTSPSPTVKSSACSDPTAREKAR